MPPRRVVPDNAREALVAQIAAAGSTPMNDGSMTSIADAEHDANQRHKALVRAAGRAAVEESLLAGTSGIKRKASEMTAVGIAAQWQAYAEVYGTNGMAAGGGRSTRAASSR